MSSKKTGVRTPSFGAGLILGLVLAGCAGFQFKYYGLDAASYEGKLLGPEAKDDLPLTSCQPDAQSKGKCVVMLEADFRAFRKDYDRVKTELRECQNGGG